VRRRDMEAVMKAVTVIAIGLLIIPCPAVDAGPVVIYSSGIYQNTKLPGQAEFDNDELPLADQVDRTYDAYRDTEDQVVIGTSQGGVRALGYVLDMMQGEAETSARIKALLLLDTPLKGHRALADGPGTLWKMRSWATVLLDGLVVPVATAFGPEASALGIAASSLLGMSAIDLLGTFVPAVQPLYSVLTRGGDTPYHGIRDLDPRGEFMTRLWSERAIAVPVTVTTSSSVTERYIDRWETRSILGRSCRVPVWATRTRAVRKTYTVAKCTSVPALARHPMDPSPGVKVGIVTGTNNDVIELACLAAGSRAPASALGAYAGTTFLLGAAWTALIAGGLWVYPPAYVAAASAWAGFAAAMSIDAVAGDIIGDRQHDGFVAFGDQSTDIEALGGTPILRGRSIVDPKEWARPDGSTAPESVNHVTVLTDERVWGEGNRFGSRYAALESAPTGIIPTWTRELRF
jgi:hypothetical protein